MEILITRQPVFDGRDELYGYELVLQRADPFAIDDEPLPEQLVADAFLGIGIDQVARGKRAFVAIDRHMLLSGAARLLPPDRVVLQLNGRFPDDPQFLHACDQLVWAGYRFAVDGNSPGLLRPEYLGFADIVTVDMSAIDRAAAASLVSRVRDYHVRMLATNVQNRTEREACIALGFELFEGYRFAAPETLTRRDIGAEHVMVFRLMKLVRDPNVSDNAIEDVLRRDVGLSYKLLRMVNSAAVGGRDIWSIGHALRILGREQIARWLGLLLVIGDKKDGVRGELMQIALVRARMCELLADASGVPRARGPLFLVGLLSLLDQLLEIPMGVLVESMELGSDVRVALLERGDFYGAVLALVEAYERGQWDAMHPLAQYVGVSPNRLAPIYLEGLTWAATHEQPSRDSLTPPTSSAVGSLPLRRYTTTPRGRAS